MWTSQSSPVATNLAGISCLTASSCYAVGDNGNVVMTTDGGVTWSLQYSIVPTSLNGISCPQQDVCYAVGGSGAVVRHLP